MRVLGRGLSRVGALAMAMWVLMRRRRRSTSKAARQILEGIEGQGGAGGGGEGGAGRGEGSPATLRQAEPSSRGAGRFAGKAEQGIIARDRGEEGEAGAGQGSADGKERGQMKAEEGDWKAEVYQTPPGRGARGGSQARKISIHAWSNQSDVFQMSRPKAGPKKAAAEASMIARV